MKRHEKIKLSLGPLVGEATGSLSVICLTVIALLVVILVL